MFGPDRDSFIGMIEVFESDLFSSSSSSISVSSERYWFPSLGDMPRSHSNSPLLTACSVTLVASSDLPLSQPVPSNKRQISDSEITESQAVLDDDFEEPLPPATLRKQVSFSTSRDPGKVDVFLKSQAEEEAKEQYMEKQAPSAKKKPFSKSTSHVIWLGEPFVEPGMKVVCDFGRATKQRVKKMNFVLSSSEKCI